MRYKSYHSPLDDAGANQHLPAALRMTSWCRQHDRRWLEAALRKLRTNVVIGHILERAAPQFELIGAEGDADDDAGGGDANGGAARGGAGAGAGAAVGRAQTPGKKRRRVPRIPR